MKWFLLIASVLFALLWSGVSLIPLLLHDRPGSPRGIAQQTPEDVSPLPPPEIPRLPDRIDFATQVVPIFQRRCFGCHQSGAGDESIESYAREVASLLNEAAADCLCLLPWADSCDENSEQCGAGLTQAEADLLARWHDEGAYCPTPQPQTADDWSDAERRHWAWQPLQPPALPPSDPQSWARNPIDAFVLARLHQEGPTPAPSADAVTLVRRLSLAATGLPPSTRDLERLNRAGPADLDAYVDELLASPAYGEHWAQFWLDLGRYADTNGYEDDGPKPLSWKYRDFVIRSWNEDRPYDEFLQMQLAGDLKQQPTADDFIAVGYLRLGPWNSEPDDELADRFDQLDDIASTTGLVFLGMTIGCARCHDHPDEPITAVDYARLVGCFHGLGRPTRGRLETAYESATGQQRAAAAIARQRQQELQRRAFFADDESQAVSLRREASRIEDDIRFEHAYRFVETDVSEEPTRLLLGGNPHHPAEFVNAGVPSVLAEGQFCESVLPRRQLAEWLVTTRRGLTARLIVNRVWAWHFGRGLVETPGNFGLSGSAPTHPELLEWLAAWFVNEANWSLKALHRLILTSQVYRTRVDLHDGRRQELYGSFPRRRLRAEVLHDAMLSIAGLLEGEMHGPPTPPPSVAHDAAALGTPHVSSDAPFRQRRAIYCLVKRNAPNPFLASFDRSNRTVTCSRRRLTHTSQQALTLWNGPLVQACADALADQIMREGSLSMAQKIDSAFTHTIGRVPDTFEREASMQFLGRQSEATGSENVAFSRFCLVLFNSDEFVFLD